MKTERYLVIFLTLILFSACTRQEPPITIRLAPGASRKTASASDLPPPEQGESWGPENEAQTDEIIEDTRQMLIDRSQGANFIRRDAHPKHHGCVKAFVKIDSSALPPELRSGIFAAGAPSEYPAWIRFSNGNPDGTNAPDINSDIRGMAVKLMGVEGAKAGSQDFVMCTAKEFFSENGADYLALHRALTGSKASLGWYLATHIRDALNLHKAEIKTANALQTQYYSAIPYKLGQGSMKFEVRPCAEAAPPEELPGKDASPNYLRERLVATLASHPACFDFLVQPNKNPSAQPIENPTIAWDESQSPLIKVATITIPQQTEIDTQAHLNFCENVSFDPWHTLPGTRPMGQISRMRHDIYPAISNFRHQYNHVPLIEPKSHEICTGESAQLCMDPRH
jgi:hypothetical protein